MCTHVLQFLIRVMAFKQDPTRVELGIDTSKLWDISMTGPGGPGGPGGNPFELGKSKARIIKDGDTKVKFADVAGGDQLQIFKVLSMGKWPKQGTQCVISYL